MRRVGIEFFEKVGGIYHARMSLHWNRIDLNDPKQALAAFLRTYAYEHQGASPDFGPIARDLVEGATQLDPSRIWKKFKNKVNRSNEALNPLFHVTSVTCPCILCRFKRVPNFVHWARKELEDDQVQLAHNRLDSIRGVGPKIASFFLRDVADFFGIEPKHNRNLLQPVDVWVGRVVEALRDPGAAGKSVPNWICQHSSHPERVNQGMWYFSARVAGSSYELNKAIRDIEYAKRLLREMAEYSKAEISASII